MKSQTPDEQGWYWCEDECGEWFMAFVSTGNDEVFLWDGQNPRDSRSAGLEDAAELFGIERWFGPFGCPGGDFHENTVVTDKPLQELAAANRNAIVLIHVDFRHCRDEGHGSSITMVSVQPRSEADKYIRKEVADIKREASQAAIKKATS